MSDETEAIEPTEPVDNLETSTEVPEEPAYTVKIDGEEQQVTLEELQQGYQRQADYTRKTQEVAAERQRLYEAEQIVSALEADPEATIQTLMSSFNINPARDQAEYQKQAEEWEMMDDNERKVAMLEQRLQQQDQMLQQRFAQQDKAQRIQQIEREVSALQDKYGEFDANDLVNHAIKNRIPNLEAAYTHMRFNEVKSTADKLSQEQEITSKKRDASVVTTGGSTQTGGSVESTPQVSSLREAFALAKQQLNQ